MHHERVRVLNDRPVREEGRYVLYWMQQAQRAHANHALEHAIELANEHGKPVIVGYGLMDDYPGANLRHYQFLLEGMADVHAALGQRGIPFILEHGSPERVAIELAGDAAAIVCDRGYTRHQRAWRKAVGDEVACAAHEVESDVVVPVEIASGKEESAARTIRPKILRLREEFLVPVEEVEPRHDGRKLRLKGSLDAADTAACLKALTRLDRTVGPVERFKGGQGEGRRRLEEFVEELDTYRERRGQPDAEGGSQLSPYLHFGQLSPVEVALAVRQATTGTSEDRSTFLEELIVRRELAANFVFYNERYDTYEALPNWAQKTLSEHAGDRRSHDYSMDELEAARTHDRYWNAAMTEMVRTGYMHNYMRMYWAKKILEWSSSPKKGFETTLHLNNKWFLDGRDCNSFANVAWCFGLHDRAWTERPVFGKIRYMNDKGLERKFDMQRYLDWTGSL